MLGSSLITWSRRSFTGVSFIAGNVFWSILREWSLFFSKTEQTFINFSQTTNNSLTMAPIILSALNDASLTIIGAIVKLFIV